MPEPHSVVRFGPDFDDVAELGHPVPIGLAPLVADFDGDGRDDVVFGSGRVGALLAPDFELEDLPRDADGERVEMVAGDIDRDGRAELVLVSAETLEIWFRADGTWHVRDGAAVPGVTSAPALGDFDGNGTLDIAVARPQSATEGAVDVFLTDADGMLIEPRIEHLLPWTSRFFHLRVQDIDGDGLDDVLVHDHVLFGEPDGALTIVEAGVFPQWGLDVDDDGDLDLVTLNQRFEVAENLDGRAFGTPYAAGAPPEGAGSTFDLVRFDGGPPQLLLRDGSDLYLQSPGEDGEFHVTREIELPDTGDTTSIVVGDFDGDGATDLLHSWTTQ